MREEWRSRPHPARLAPDHPLRAEILAAHERALQASAALYPDPLTGMSVLTADYLAGRGTCCGRGCRHCPYVDDGASGATGPLD